MAQQLRGCEALRLPSSGCAASRPRPCSRPRRAAVRCCRARAGAARDCFFGVRRFNDLQLHLDVPRAVLTARLGALVDGGVLRRETYAPGRDEYVLTSKGLELWPALHALMEWGESASPRGRVRILRHVGCETDLDARGACTACGTVPSVADLEIRPGPGVRNDRRRTDAVSIALRSPHRLLDPLVA